MHFNCIVLCALTIVSSAYAMEQPEANLPAAADQQPMNNKDLYALINSPALRNPDGIIAQYILDKPIKDYLLASMMRPDIADFKNMSMRADTKLSMSPNNVWLADAFPTSNILHLYNLEAAQHISCKLSHPIGYESYVLWSPDSSRIAVFTTAFLNQPNEHFQLQIFDVSSEKEIPLILQGTQNQFTMRSSAIWHPAINELIVYSPNNNSLTTYNANDGAINQHYDLNTYNVAAIPGHSFIWAHPTQPIICFGSGYRQIFFDLNANTVLLEYTAHANSSYSIHPQLITNSDGTQAAMLTQKEDQNFNMVYSIDIIDLATQQVVKSTTLDIQQDNKIDSVVLLPWHNRNVISCLVQQRKKGIPDNKILAWLPHNALAGSNYIASYDIAKDMQFSTTLMERVVPDCINSSLMGTEWLYVLPEIAVSSYTKLLTKLLEVLSKGVINKALGGSNADLAEKFNLVYRLYTTDQYKNAQRFFNESIDHSLSLPQALLLNAIGEQYIFTSEGPKVKFAHEPYDLNAESHAVFKTLPDAIQRTLKPLVVEHNNTYYTAENAYNYSGKWLKKQRWLLKNYGMTGFAKIKANNAWERIVEPHILG